LDKDKKTKKKPKKKVFSVLINIFSLIVTLVIILIPLSLGVIMVINSPVQNTGNIIPSEIDAIRLLDDGSYMIDVRRGETSQSVGLRLERAGLINNRYFWNILCRLDKEHIKTGTYKIEMPASLLSIHRLLISGREILYSVTIPEGVTLRKTARILDDAGICSYSAFLGAARDPSIINFYGIPNASMEGYLFPDTYFFPSDYPAAGVIRTMLDTFFEKLVNIEPNILNMSQTELNRYIIIASIVEREYRQKDEAALMAGVFFNRLNIGMALQSCATVEYVITEIQGRPHPEVLYNRDLEIRNPYNTYYVPGLPPGPISSPGVTALNAAFNPQRSDYLYFRLIDPSSGKHYFSRTLDDHIRAGLLYLKN